jgi:hypothetical protein
MYRRHNLSESAVRRLTSHAPIPLITTGTPGASDFIQAISFQSKQASCRLQSACESQSVREGYADAHGDSLNVRSHWACGFRSAAPFRALVCFVGCARSVLRSGHHYAEGFLRTATVSTVSHIDCAPSSTALLSSCSAIALDASAPS